MISVFEGTFTWMNPITPKSLKLNHYIFDCDHNILRLYRWLSTETSCSVSRTYSPVAVEITGKRISKKCPGFTQPIIVGSLVKNSMKDISPSPSRSTCLKTSCILSVSSKFEFKSFILVKNSSFVT